MVSGIVAVSAPDASAIERSKPAIFWKRLTTRSTNCGRSQNVNVRVTRSRSRSRRSSAVIAASGRGTRARYVGRQRAVRAAYPVSRSSSASPRSGDR